MTRSPEPEEFPKKCQKRDIKWTFPKFQISDHGTLKTCEIQNLRKKIFRKAAITFREFEIFQKKFFYTTLVH